MKPYSIDFREKVVKAYEQGDTSIRKVAARFDVSKAFVQKLLKQKQTTGDVRPQKQGGSLKSVLHERQANWLRWWKNIRMAPCQNIVNIGKKVTSNGSAPV
jgi:transposase